MENTGSSGSTLSVNMKHTSAKGRASTVTVASLTAGSSWSLSTSVLFLQNIQPLLDSYGCTYVTFSFVPSGKNGKWQIDDFYVDPVKHH